MYSFWVSFLPVKTALSALMTMTKSPVSHVRGEDGLVLAAQENGGFLGHAAHHLVLGINHKPLPVDLFGLGAKSFHREPDIRPASAGHVKKILPKNEGRR